MKRSAGLISASIAPAVFFIAIHQDIPAYLDAGTGSIILQAVLGALVGALVAVKLFWGQIKSFFARLFHRSKRHEEPQDQQD
jgi:cytochrome b